MAGSLPTVRSGGACLYPLTRRREYVTNVNQFVSGAEQRWKKRAPLMRFRLEYLDLTLADRTAIETFFNSQKGQFDTTFSITLPAPAAGTYTNLCFEDDLIRWEERKPRYYSTTLRVRQTQNRAFATPSASAVYPTLGNGAVTQLPYVRIRKFITAKNDAVSGERYAFAWYGGGLTGLPTGALMAWELNYPALPDTDLAILETFFEAMNARWKTFSFTDPDDAVVHASCRFAMDVFEARHVGPNHNAVVLPIEETG